MNAYPPQFVAYGIYDLPFKLIYSLFQTYLFFAEKAFISRKINLVLSKLAPFYPGKRIEYFHLDKAKEIIV